MRECQQVSNLLVKQGYTKDLRVKQVSNLRVKNSNQDYNKQILQQDIRAKQVFHKRILQEDLLIKQVYNKDIQVKQVSSKGQLLVYNKEL